MHVFTLYQLFWHCSPVLWLKAPQHSFSNAPENNVTCSHQEVLSQNNWNASYWLSTERYEEGSSQEYRHQCSTQVCHHHQSIQGSFSIICGVIGIFLVVWWWGYKWCFDLRLIKFYVFEWSMPLLLHDVDVTKHHIVPVFKFRYRWIR